LPDLPRAAELRLLSLPPAAAQLAGIVHCRGLEELRLQDASDRVTPDEWGSLLGELPDLRRLTLSPQQLSMLLFAPRTEIPQVTHLTVRARPGAPVPLRRIARRLPGLEEIHLSQVSELDLGSLAGLRRLRLVRLSYAGEIRGADTLPDSVELDIHPHP
ncbi:ATP-binding protein, partial [Streptomyces niveus]